MDSLVILDSQVNPDILVSLAHQVTQALQDILVSADIRASLVSRVSLVNRVTREPQAIPASPVSQAHLASVDTQVFLVSQVKMVQ